MALRTAQAGSGTMSLNSDDEHTALLVSRSSAFVDVPTHTGPFAELEDQEELLAGAHGDNVSYTRCCPATIGPTGIVPFWVVQDSNWRRARLFINIYGWILALFIVTWLAVAHVPIMIGPDNSWQSCPKGPKSWCTVAYHVFSGTYPGISSVSTPSACR